MRLYFITLTMALLANFFMLITLASELKGVRLDMRAMDQRITIRQDSLLVNVKEPPWWR